MRAAYLTPPPPILANSTLQKGDHCLLINPQSFVYHGVMSIGELVTKRRKELGLTKADLARRCDVHYNTICNIEANRGNPSYKNLVKLETALGIHLHHKEEGNETTNSSPAP